MRVPLGAVSSSTLFGGRTFGECWTRSRPPTLVIYRSDPRQSMPDHAEYVAAHIPDARLVALPGQDGFVFTGDTDAALDVVREFLTGAKTVDVTGSIGSSQQSFSPTSSTRLPMRPTSVIARGGDVSMTTTPW